MRIFITRHGKSIYNVENRIGGDSSLSDEGKEYAKKLATFCSRTDSPSIAYCSTKKRTIETLASDNFSSYTVCPELDEIDAGLCEHLTYDEMKREFPKEFANRLADKLNYRYPKGESYRDLFARVKPFVDRIVDNTEDVLVVCHQAVTRALLYHLTTIPVANIPNFEVPLHRLVCLTGEPGQMTLEILTM